MRAALRQLPPAGPAAQPSVESVAQLQEMGFPEGQCRAALAAACNDAQRATQFLLEGIPEGAAGPAAAVGEGAPVAEVGALAVFRWCDSDAEVGLDEGLLSLCRPILLCMENPCRENK